MGKKGTKRRTRWRTLSITDSADEATSAVVSPTNSSNATLNNEEVSSKDDTYRHPNTSYLRRKPLYDSSANVRSGYSRSYYRQQNGGFPNRNPYYRRSVQNGASRYFNYRNGAQNYRSTDVNKEYNQTRPVINEEEYTRITTPRQDVIFKKGYLSQPRKYLSSTDTNTTSSAAASVVSTEESNSAASVPSLSPEQCSSYAESIDPEQAFMYSYFDQNGVFYFNPYLPNGFDQYAGQMFMLPYSYQPYNVYPSDVNSPLQSTDIEETPTSTDSNENLSDNKEKNKQETTPESQTDCDAKTDSPSTENATTKHTEQTSENVMPQAEQIEITTNQTENFYNYGYQQFYPQVFFPYMYGQQFMPMIETDYELYNECCDENTERRATFKNRRRTRLQNDGSSAGVTTTNYSEEDNSDKENISDNPESRPTEKISTDTAVVKPESTEESKKIVFNADVKEFIPRQSKPHLNVNVKEFLPKNYKPKRSTTSCIETDDKNTVAVEIKEDVPKPQRNTSKSDKVSVKESPQQSNTATNTTANTEHVSRPEPTLSPKPTEEIPKLTLAERIKRGFTKDTTDTEIQASPPKNNPANLGNRKNLKKTETKRATVREIPGMTFAKILTKEKSKPAKNQAKSSNAANTSNKPEKNPAKEPEKEIQKRPEPIMVQSEPTAEKGIILDEWQTVKPKGKRGRHFIKEVAVFEDIPTKKEEALDQKVPDEIVQKDEIVKTICKVPSVNENEKVVENIEKEILLETPEPESKVQSNEKALVSLIVTNPDVQTTQKKNKLRNKKIKKNLTPLKKIKGKEPLKILNEEKDEKTDQPEEDKSLQKEDSLVGIAQEDHLLDSLYLMDRNNPLLNKTFCRNPLEILNGFDCKFKGNKSILKEEEDMVLNVIKSLSNSQGKMPEFKFPESAQNELNFESTAKTAPTINEDQQETGSSIKKNSEETEMPIEFQKDTKTLNSNGMSIDCDSECPEDLEEDTIVQETPQENQILVSDKLSDTESLSDLSVENFEKESDTKDCLAEVEINTQKIGSKTICPDKEQSELYEKCNNAQSASEIPKNKNESTAIDEYHEKPSSLSSYNSLEENDLDLSNGPKELIVVNRPPSEVCDLLNHDSLEENVVLLEYITTSPITTKTASITDDTTPVIGTAIETESDTVIADETLHNKIDATIKVNGTIIDEDLPQEATKSIEINKIQIDDSLLQKMNNSINGEQEEPPLNHIGTLNLFKCTSEEKIVPQAIFEKETDEEFNNEQNTSNSQVKNVTCLSDEEKEREHVLNEIETKNSLPKEVPPVRIVFTESKAPEQVYPQCESNGASQDNEIHANDYQENEKHLPESILLEKIEVFQQNADLSASSNLIEKKDPTIDLIEDGDLLLRKDVEEKDLPLDVIPVPQSENLLATEVASKEECHPENYGEENKTAGNCLNFTADEKLDIDLRNGITKNALNEDYLSFECISPTNDSGIISSPTSFCQISSETHDSNKIDLSTINIPALDEDPSKYPLTIAVREWLNNEAKEKTPEPLLRMPDDPKLSSIITSALIEQTDRRDGDHEGDWSSEESDIEGALEQPKNLLGNPSRVSSANLTSNDNDSDYNSDSQLRFDEDDNTGERVANIISDKDRDRSDLLDYWDDEFVRDPKKWLGASSCTNDDKESVFSTTSSEPVLPYESVYGKSIDYERLLASNYEFLSNNIISFNDTATPAGNKSERTDGTRLNNNNFGTNINDNHNNCLKPPEVCCMIM